MGVGGCGVSVVGGVGVGAGSVSGGCSVCGWGVWKEPGHSKGKYFERGLYLLPSEISLVLPV